MKKNKAMLLLVGLLVSFGCFSKSFTLTDIPNVKITPTFGDNSNFIYTTGTQTSGDYKIYDSPLISDIKSESYTVNNYFSIESASKLATDIRDKKISIVNPSETICSFCGLRTTPVRVVTFGDSTAAIGSLQSPATYDFRRVKSTTWQSDSVNFIQYADKYLLSSFYPQAYLVGNGGISGQNTTTMLARDGLAPSTTRAAISDMLGLSPNVVLLRGGSINDISGVTSDTVSSVVVATYLRHLEIIDRFMDSGVKVIDCGIFGFSGKATDNTSTRLALVQLNDLFRKFAQSNPTKVKFIDPNGVVSDSVGNFFSDSSTDGVHLTLNAQYKISKLEAQAVTEWFGTSSNTRYQGYNNIANSMLTTYGTAFGGNWASLQTTSYTGGTPSNAKIESINGKIYQTIEFSITGAGNVGINKILDFSATGSSFIAPLNIDSGDVYGFEMDVYVEILNGASISGMSFSGNIYIPDSIGKGSISVYVLNSAYTLTATGVMEFHLIIPPVQFGDVQANLLSGNFGININHPNVLATYKIGVGNLRCVKLNQAILTN